MRTFINILLSLLFGGAVGFGAAQLSLAYYRWNPELEFKEAEQINREINAKRENPNAKVRLDKTEFDFGIMDKGEKGRHDFTIQNVGSAPLTLEMNATTCSCTGIDISPKHVPPGGTATITLHWNAERAMGQFKQGGTVLTNDPENKEIMYTIKGLFTSSVIPVPNAMTLPGFPSSRGNRATFRLLGFEQKPLEIALAQWEDKEHFDVTFASSELTEEEKKNVLYKNATSVMEAILTVKPGLPLGAFQQKFVLTTNFTREPRVEYVVRGQVFGEGVMISGPFYQKETGMLQIGKTLFGKTLVRDFSVSFTGASAEKSELRVAGVLPSWLKVSVSEPRKTGIDAAARRIYTVTIEVPADAPVSNYMNVGEAHDALLTLDTGTADSPPIKIPLQFAVEK